MEISGTKIVALYLPQYYETSYNDEWWGKGYTEWVACKAAKPLFRGHCQPRVPLNDWYYDLSLKYNIKKQIDLAQNLLWRKNMGLMDLLFINTIPAEKSY